VHVPPESQADIHSPFTGQLMSQDGFTPPTLGQSVEAGQVLALVEQAIEAPARATLGADVQRLESELQQAREQASLAANELERVQALGEAASAKRLAEAETALRVAQQNVQGLANALQQFKQADMNEGAGSRLIEIRSPLDGVIITSHATPGEYVEPAKLLYEVVNPDHVHVEADIYESDLAVLTEASKALIRSDAYPDVRFEGDLHFVSSRLEQDTRTVPAHFHVDNHDRLLRDGMFVTVEIETDKTETGVMVPKSSVVNNQGVNMVYVKTSPETFVSRQVHVVGTWGDRIMVSSGVEPEDIVVVQGMYQVRASAQ